MGDEDDNRWPPWLKPMLKESFFVQCELHADSHKRECKMYCLDCINGPLCSLCLVHHIDHRVIQIRRSSYHDVVRVNEIHKYLDISEVQTYVINSASVVFLNQRPQLRPAKGVTITCNVCDRSLLNSFRFCSLACKIVGTSKNFVKKTKRLPEKMKTPAAKTEAVADKVQRFSPAMPPASSVNYRSGRRRKGIPHRAPTGGLIIGY